MRGVREFTGATVMALAATPTLDHLADAIQRLETANAGARPALFMHSRTWGSLRKQKDTQNRYQLGPDPAEVASRRIFGIEVFVSNQIPTNLGAGTSESWIALVDMDQVAVARRKDITVEYSGDYAFNADQTAVRTLARFDIAPLNVAGVQILSAVLA
jgi:HK97 family phage major capsid protein